MEGWNWRRHDVGHELETDLGDTAEREGIPAAYPAGPPVYWLAGRRYLADVPYLLPKDAQELIRLDFQHHLLRRALGRHALAPLDRPASILDVGCGTGRWAREMAEVYPQARVVGLDLDLAPLREQVAAGHTGPLPALNCTFVAGDLLGGLPFASGTFDYVHMCFLGAAIPATSWQSAANELARVTRPGGWVEIVETAWMPHAAEPATRTLFRWALEAGLRQRINLQLPTRLGALVHAAGLAHVAERTIELPVGRAGGRLGAMAAAHALALLTAIRPLIVAYGIADDARFEATLATARAELERRACIYPIYVVYGQRPA